MMPTDTNHDAAFSGYSQPALMERIYLGSDRAVRVVSGRIIRNSTLRL
jgi:hypothetical protein